MFVVLLILILIVLSVMFGGFQKGTKTGSLNHSPASATFTSALYHYSRIGSTTDR
jgi:hypothetical protein